MVRLHQRRVDALEPRETAYDVRDDELKGFCVRVLSSGGKRYFVHSQRDGRRVWKIVGKDIAEGRSPRAGEGRSGRDPRRDAAGGADVVRGGRGRSSVTGGTGNRARSRSTAAGSRSCRGSGERGIAEITRRDVQRWFASLHATPAAADSSAPILSVIMRQAEVYGYRPEDSNPCKGIRRYRRQGRERFLTVPEIRRLGAVLAGREPDRRVAIVRLCC